MKAGVVVALSAALTLAVPGFAAAQAGGRPDPSPATASRAKNPRPNCKALLPITKVEAVMGGAVTLEHFGKSDFIRNATTPGTEAGTECVYATTEATANDYGIAGTVSTAFAETPQQWNAYRASAKKYPGLEATSFESVKLGGGNQAFALHQDGSGAGEPDVFYLYVFTPLHNMFSIDFLGGVTLPTEEGVARELSLKLDKEWKQLH
jgi:hypothetical protein